MKGGKTDTKNKGKRKKINQARKQTLERRTIRKNAQQKTEGLINDDQAAPDDHDNA